MVTLTEALHAGAFLITAERRHPFDAISIAQNQTLVTGQVLGRRLQSADLAAVTSSVAADAGNTGTGVFTLDGTAPVAQGAKDGNYRVVCAAVATNSGTFDVFDPDGHEIGRAVVGATFNNQIKFVIADGTPDFVIGDAFTVTVGIQDPQYEYAALNESGTDGTQNVAGILFAGVTTTSANVQATGLVRGNAEVRGTDLTWPAGSTAAQQAEGSRQLERLGIIVR
jgi:hypothetical protein